MDRVVGLCNVNALTEPKRSATDIVVAENFMVRLFNKKYVCGVFCKVELTRVVLPSGSILFDLLC